MAEAATLDSAPPTRDDKRPSLTPFGTLFGVLLKPRATFKTMRSAERGHWWLLFVLAFISLVISTAALIPLEVEAAEEALAAQQELLEDMPEAQRAQVEQTQRIMSSTAVLGGIGTATGTVGLLAGYVLRAVILFLLGIALGGRASFKQVWRMAVWTTLPNVVRNLVSAVAVFATGGMPERGLAFMYNPAELSAMSAFATTVLRNIDLYMVWGLALVALGVTATAQVSRLKGAISAVVYWLLTVAAAAGFAALGQSLVQSMGFGG